LLGTLLKRLFHLLAALECAPPQLGPTAIDAGGMITGASPHSNIRQHKTTSAFAHSRQPYIDLALHFLPFNAL
jgi:hypothetical protein